MFREILTDAQQTVLELLSRIPEIQTFYLAGGTALACRERAPIEDVFGLFREKYRGLTVDSYHLLRSLTFFDDAEAEVMPELLRKVTWDEIKTFFRTEAARLFRSL